MTILERLRAATGPDRELDADILEATGGCAHKETEYYCIEDGNDCDSGFTCKKCGTDTYGAKIERYTASIDAALALVKRMLPGWVVDDLSQAARFAGNPWGCALGFYDAANPRMNKMEKSWHEFPTAPLAILTALFAALEAKEKSK